MNKISNFSLFCFEIGNQIETNEIYSSANLKSEQLCKRFIIGTFLTLSGVYLMPFIVPAISYLNGTYSADVWFLPYPAT